MLAGEEDDRRNAARRRLVAGLVVAVARDGYRSVSVSNVLTAAGCARRSFYTYFESLDACLHVAHDRATDHVAELVTDAWVRGSAVSMAAGLEAALERLASFASDDEDLARFWLCEAPAAGGPVIWRQQQRVLDRLAAFARPVLAPGPADEDDPAELPWVFARAVVAMLRERVRRGDAACIDLFARDAMRVAAWYAPGATAPALAVA